MFTFKVNVASIAIPVQSAGENSSSISGHQQSFGAATIGSVPSPAKTFRSREEKEEEEAQERRMRRREEEERRRERELFLSGKATPPPAMVCIVYQSPCIAKIGLPAPRPHFHLSVIKKVCPSLNQEGKVCP